MLVSAATTTLLLATAPAVLLLGVGLAPLVLKRAHGAVSATALAAGLALAVLQLFIIGVLSVDLLYDLADSRLLMFGLPLSAFIIMLGVLSHRNRLSLISAAACAVIGIAGLWYLGGFVVINTACGVSPNAGC